MSPSPGVCTVLDHIFWVRLGVLEKVLRHVALRVNPIFVDYDPTNFLKHCFAVSCLFVQIHASLLAIASSKAPHCLMSGWVCQWNSFRIPVEDSCKKAFVEEWVSNSDAPCEGPSTAEDPMVHDTDPSEYISVTPLLRNIPLRYLGRPRSAQDKSCF